MLFGAFHPAARQRRFLQGLHLFYAGFFALILPFICWGAQATPGHPHAIAHFVFAAPSKSTVMATVGLDAAAYLTTFGKDDICSSTESSPPHQRANDAPQLPAGRSVPMLMIFLLLLAAAAATPLLSSALRPSVLKYWSVPPPGGLSMAVPTPPPR